MQTAFIVTQRLPIVDIDRQPTIFSVTQCFPIIAHVNMHANSFSRHTTSPCYLTRQHETLHRQASNYFRRQTLFPYYRSREYSRE